MKKSKTRSKFSKFALKAEKAFKKAVKEEIEDHARTGDPVVIWKNGKVVRVPAEQILREPSAKYGRRKKK